MKSPWFVIFLALASPRAALAQRRHARHEPAPDASSEARRRFRRALELADEGSYAAALSEFQRVYDLTRNPAVLFNLSATWEAMGAFAESLDALERFATTAPSSLLDARRAELDAARVRLRARTGTLSVHLDHPGLNVAVDGIDRPGTAPRAGLRLSTGPHRVRLMAPGFRAREEAVSIVGDAEVVIDAPLAPEESFIAVTCDVADAEVRIDGVARAVTPVRSPLAVTDGAHRVEVRRPGYRTYSAEVVARGLGARVDAELTWDTPLTESIGARLAVATNEPDATASIDGRVVARDGSALVPPGRHSVRVSRQGFVATTRAVDLPAGGALRLAVPLAPTRAFRDEYLAGAARARAAGLWSLVGGGAFVAVGALMSAVAFSARGDTVATMNALADDFNLHGTTGCLLAPCSAVAQEYERQGDALVRQDVLIGVGIGVAVLGVAGAITGSFLLARAPSRSRFERAPTFTLNAGEAALGLAGRF